MDFTLDSLLAMKEHVSNISHGCYVAVHRLASIRRFLRNTAAATLASALSTTESHCCFFMIMMWHPTYNAYRTMQLKSSCALWCQPIYSLDWNHFVGFLSTYDAPTYNLVLATTINAILCHYMSLICCYKINHIYEVLTQVHTLWLFSIDLHTVTKHLVIACFLLPLLPGTPFQMTSGVLHRS